MQRLAYLVTLALGIGLLVRACVGEKILIASASMAPTLPVGTELFVNKLVYLTRGPRRGEIVVFPSPVEKKDLVKRVIAVAGDQVRIEAKKVILNGRPLPEPYAVHDRPEMLMGDNVDLGRVPDGHVLLMGDNRDHSQDSRDWVDPKTGKPLPFIPLRLVRGKLMTDK